MSKRHDEVPGVGPVLATALVASIAEPNFPIGTRLLKRGSGWYQSRVHTHRRAGRRVSISSKTKAYPVVRASTVKALPLRAAKM
jgi:hypothetical protein